MTSCTILIIAELIIYIIYRIIKSHFKKKQRNQGIPYEYYNEEGDRYEYYNDEESDDKDSEEYHDEEEKESDDKGVILGDSGFYISATKVVDNEPFEENDESEIPKKTATMEENLEWFEINFSKLVTNHQGKWIVISNREIVKIGDDYQEMRKFRDSYSKLDINCINVHCIDLNLYYNNTTDVEKSSRSIGAANSIINYVEID